jgi:hypothetical protein
LREAILYPNFDLSLAGSTGRIHHPEGEDEDEDDDEDDEDEDTKDK